MSWVYIFARLLVLSTVAMSVHLPATNSEMLTPFVPSWIAGFSLRQCFAKHWAKSYHSPVSLACLVSLCQQRKANCCLFPSPALIAAGLVR